MKEIEKDPAIHEWWDLLLFYGFPIRKKEDRPDINDEQKGMKKKVAIQGIAGSYHDVAAQRYFEGEAVEPVPCDTFREVIEHVSAGTVGIVAVCWRLIAEYLPFLIGFYYTLAVFGREFLRRY